MVAESLLRACCCLTGYYYGDNYDELSETEKDEKTNLNDRTEVDYNTTVLENNVAQTSDDERRQVDTSLDNETPLSEHVPGCPESSEFKEILANRIAASKPALDDDVSQQRNSWRAASFAMNFAANKNQMPPRFDVAMESERKSPNDTDAAKRRQRHSAFESLGADKDSNSSSQTLSSENDSIPSDISEIDSSKDSDSNESEFDIGSPKALSIDLQAETNVEATAFTSDKSSVDSTDDDDVEDSTASCYSLSSPVSSDNSNHGNKEEVYNLLEVDAIRIIPPNSEKSNAYPAQNNGRSNSNDLSIQLRKTIDPSRYPKLPVESDSTSIATEDLSDISTDESSSWAGGSSSSQLSESSDCDYVDIDSGTISITNSGLDMPHKESVGLQQLSDIDGASRTSSRLGTEVSSTIADTATLVGSSEAPSRADSQREVDDNDNGISHHSNHSDSNNYGSSDDLQEKSKKKKGLVSKIKKRVLR